MEYNFSNLSTIAIFDNSLLWEAFSGHCRVSSSMAGPYPIDAYSITQLWQSKSISRHCLSPGGQIWDIRLKHFTGSFQAYQLGTLPIQLLLGVAVAHYCSTLPGGKVTRCLWYNLFLLSSHHQSLKSTLKWSDSGLSYCTAPSVQKAQRDSFLTGCRVTWQCINILL